MVEEGRQEDDVTTAYGVHVIDEEVGEAVLEIIPLDFASEEEGLITRKLQNFFGQLLHSSGR